jgi:hypothetical protein
MNFQEPPFDLDFYQFIFTPGNPCDRFQKSVRSAESLPSSTRFVSPHLLD